MTVIWMSNQDISSWFRNNSKMKIGHYLDVLLGCCSNVDVRRYRKQAYSVILLKVMCTVYIQKVYKSSISISLCHSNNMISISWFVKLVLCGVLLDMETTSPSGPPPHNHVAVFGVRPQPLLAWDAMLPSGQCLLCSLFFQAGPTELN